MKSSFNLENLKWCCLGDSLTEVNNRTTIHYHDYISRATGIRVINLGESGSGYAAKREVNRAFFQRISEIPKDSDIVTIFGSGNDIEFAGGIELGSPADTSLATICGYMNRAIELLKERFRDSRTVLGIISPTPWRGEALALASYTSALEEICRRHKIAYLDLFNSSPLKPDDSEFLKGYYSKDDGFFGVHPNERGHALIAPQIFEFIIGLYTNKAIK